MTEHVLHLSEGLEYEELYWVELVNRPLCVDIDSDTGL